MSIVDIPIPFLNQIYFFHMLSFDKFKFLLGNELFNNLDFFEEIIHQFIIFKGFVP